MKKIMKALHKQNLNLDPKYKFFHDKHVEFTNRFDELSEYDKGTKEDYQSLCLELIEAFGDLYFFDKNK